MSTSLANARNTLIEDLGGGLFRSTPAPSAPAYVHEKLPVSWVVPSGGGTFLATAENSLVSADTTLDNGNLQLPSASGIGGTRITAKNRKGANVLTVLPTGSEKIDDHNDVPLAERTAATFVAIDDDVETGWLVESCCTDIS